MTHIRPHPFPTLTPTPPSQRNLRSAPQSGRRQGQRTHPASVPHTSRRPSPHTPSLHSSQRKSPRRSTPRRNPLQRHGRRRNRRRSLRASPHRGPRRSRSLRASHQIGPLRSRRQNLRTNPRPGPARQRTSQQRPQSSTLTLPHLQTWVERAGLSIYIISTYASALLLVSFNWIILQLVSRELQRWPSCRVPYGRRIFLGYFFPK